MVISVLVRIYTRSSEKCFFIQKNSLFKVFSVKYFQFYWKWERMD